MVHGMEYSELQRRNQLGRMKAKLAAKQAAEAAAAAPADAVEKAEKSQDAAADSTEPNSPTSSTAAAAAEAVDEKPMVSVAETAAAAALEAMAKIDEEEARKAAKAAKGQNAVTKIVFNSSAPVAHASYDDVLITLETRCAVLQDMLEAAGEVSQKVCKVGKIAVHTQDGSADLTPQERARLTAAIGNGKNQNVRCWTNAVGQALAIDDTVVDPKEGASAALVFSGCKGCTYTISATCAK
eukprot:7540-Heterococcus_DN1.PRE.1